MPSMVTITWVLTALATLAVELAVADPGAAGWWAPARAGVGISLALVGRRLFARTPSLVIAATLTAFAAPTVWTLARSAALGRILAMESALLTSLSALGLGLAAMSSRPSFARLAALLSLFQMVAAVSSADGPAIPALAAAYAAAGGVWLVLDHWWKIRPTSTEATERTHSPGRPPAVPLAAAFTAIGLVVAGVAAGPTRVAGALAGIFPSSGGTDWDDPDANSGVDDGENEVKGASDPQSIGFADSDHYLESDRPSLYDAFSDMYGEPVRPKRQDRMMSLAPTDVAEQREAPAENLRAGREFSAVRRRDASSPKRKPKDRQADALLYVKGRTPLHLGLASYERFDGRQWSETTSAEGPHPLVREDRAEPWFRLDLPERKPPAPSVVGHQLKIGVLESSPMPAPPLLRAFRVGAISQSDFFDWPLGGRPRMAGRTVPSSTVVETESHAVDPERLQSTIFAPPPVSQPEAPPFGCSCSDEVRRLMHSWIEGRAHGWARIQAIIEGLKRHAACDPSAVVPPDCPNAVEHFLLTSRRGPDFLFASAAVMVLRESGHRARLVTGLYARPDRYDARTRHTPVLGDDVHVWAEVQTIGGDWIPVEPTPGYQLMTPPPTWLQSATAALRTAWAWTVAHRTEGLALVILTALIGVFRRELSDLAATLAWRLGVGGAPRPLVLRTIGLVERRARLGGRPRPSGETLRRWYGPLGAGEPSPALGDDLGRLVSLAEWSLYAPMNAPPPTPDDVTAACRAAVRAWTWKRFRHGAATGPASRTPA